MVDWSDLKDKALALISTVKNLVSPSPAPGTTITNYSIALPNWCCSC